MQLRHPVVPVLAPDLPPYLAGGGAVAGGQLYAAPVHRRKAARHQALHAVNGRARLLQPAVGYQVVGQPLPARAVIRVELRELLIVAYQRVVVVYVPVPVRAARSRAQAAVQPLAPGLQRQPLAGILTGARHMALRAMHVQVAQQLQTVGAAALVAQPFNQEALGVVKVVLAQELLVRYHVAYPLHVHIVGHGEQLVYRHAEEHRQPWQQLYVGRAQAVFPLAYGLAGNVQLLRQLLLRYAPVRAQRAYPVSQFHEITSCIQFRPVTSLYAPTAPERNLRPLAPAQPPV